MITRVKPEEMIGKGNGGGLDNRGDNGDMIVAEKKLEEVNELKAEMIDFIRPHYNISHVVLRNSIRDWYRLIVEQFL